MSYIVRNIIVVLLGIALFIGTPFILHQNHHYNTNEEFEILEETVKDAYLAEEKLIQIPENVNLDMSDAPEKISANFMNSPHEYVVGKIVDGKFQTIRQTVRTSIIVDYFIPISILVTAAYAIITMVAIVLYDNYIEPYFRKLKHEKFLKLLAAKEIQKICEEGPQ